MTAPDEVLTKRSAPAGIAAGALAELRTNRRAAIGLVAVALLVGGYGLLVLGDANDALRRAYVQQDLRLQRLVADRTGGGWQARAADSTVLRQTLEKRLWPADSEGVARANLQEWVVKAGHDSGLERVRVTIELTRLPGLAPDLRKLTATITAALNEEALTRLLDHIARDPHLLVVDRLHAQQAPIASLEMTLFAYARLTPPQRPSAK